MSCTKPCLLTVPVLQESTTERMDIDWADHSTAKKKMSHHWQHRCSGGHLDCWKMSLEQGLQEGPYLEALHIHSMLVSSSSSGSECTEPDAGGWSKSHHRSPPFVLKT